MTTHRCYFSASINNLTRSSRQAILRGATEFQLKTKSQWRKVSTLDFLFWGVLWRRLLQQISQILILHFSWKSLREKCKHGQFLKSSYLSQFDFKSDLRSWGLAFREKHFRDHDVSRWESLQKIWHYGYCIHCNIAMLLKHIFHNMEPVFFIEQFAEKCIIMKIKRICW